MDEKEQRVLVVDDLPTNLQIIGIALNKIGIKAIVAQNGAQALKIANQNPPDLILLDIMMPGMDGYEVCEKLKNNKETKDIPVIFITAKNQIDDVIKGFDVGGVDYITKPFNSRELEKRVLTHLDLKHARDTITQKNIELQDLNATKDKMYSIIAHDLRGPIGNFQVVLDLLLEHDDKFDAETVNKYLDMLRGAAKNSFYLLDNLLNWSKIQRNEVAYQPDSIFVGKLIEETVKLLGLNAVNKNIEIEQQIDDNAIAFVDAQMIQTVIRNLLNNAIKFTREGGKIIVSAHKSNDYVELQVADNGVGIPEEVRSKLFNPAVHITTYGTNNEKGSGLGLNLCYDFVVSNKGTIEVESEEGKGSSFIVKLPTNVQ